jgi:hypothetical protein
MLPRHLRLLPFGTVALAAVSCTSRTVNTGNLWASAGERSDGGVASAPETAADGGALAADASRIMNASPTIDASLAAEASPVSDASDASPVDATTPPSDASACPGAFVCDDFERYAAGAAPTAPWTVAKNAGTIAVDTTRAHSGTQSVKVTAPLATGYQSVMLRIAGEGLLPVPSNVVYGRMMFWLDSSPTTSVHFTLVDGSGLVSDAGYHAVYRYGGQLPLTGPDGGFFGSQVMASYDTTDSYSGVGPASDCFQQSQGRVVPLGAWTCIEWEFDGPNDTMRFWIGGAPAPDLTVSHTGAGCISQPEGYEWTSPSFSQLDIGWESYQADGARALWIDDVAFSTSRIGCP